MAFGTFRFLFMIMICHIKFSRRKNTQHTNAMLSLCSNHRNCARVSHFVVFYCDYDLVKFRHFLQIYWICQMIHESTRVYDMKALCIISGIYSTVFEQILLRIFSNAARSNAIKVRHGWLMTYDRKKGRNVTFTNNVAWDLIDEGQS